MTRVITVTSGKGGVGKTNISLNLALSLCNMGFRTCLFDADLGLANINILMKLNPEYNLEDVILNDKPLKDIIIRGYNGIDIIPGSSGVEQMANLSDDQIERLIEAFSNLGPYDFFILDTSAGVSRDVIAFCMGSSEIMLVITPDPTSLTDAYALLKILHINGFRDPVMVVINQIQEMNVAKIAYTKLKTTAQKYLSIQFVLMGTVTADPHVVASVREQKPFIALYPYANVSKCVKNIASQLVHKRIAPEEDFFLDSFWTKCLSLFKSPLKMGKRKSSNKPETEKTEQVSATTDPEPTSGEQPTPFELTEVITNNAPNNTGNPDGTAEMTTMMHTTNILLRQVVDSIATVSQELEQIRQLLQGNTLNKSVPSEQIVAPPPLTDRDKVINNIAHLLSTFSMFQALDDQHIREVVSYLRFQQFEKDDIVLHKGHPGKDLYIIISGSIEVIGDDGVNIAFLEKGDVFGEMSLISGDPVAADIKVVEQTNVLYLDGKNFLKVLRKFPPLQMYFARLLTQRLTRANIVRTKILTSGLNGVLSETSASELLQTLNMHKKTGVLSLQLQNGPAKVSFRQGRVINAQYRNMAHQEAFFEILKATKGRFTFVPGLPTSELESVEIGHFMQLLIEGLSRIDEGNISLIQ